jgi:Asp-tRNA(Asn)/Glu-tRNA(Gln) amidotransferase A subunit family amidase
MYRIPIVRTGALIAFTASLAGQAPPTRAQSRFVLEETTIRSIHEAFASGQLSCSQLTRAYLNRIEAYDHRGPSLNAIITVNRRAMDSAADMDRVYSAGAARERPLHCIPVILKDNYDTADMPTTGGAKTLAGSVPLDDAFIVKRLRQAGALILAKANLGELAIGDGTTVSSLGGRTRNPYDLLRTPGGSSGGTGAAIAANFAVVGTGTDTGQSVRSPASAQSLVGLRPTRGLLSRNGLIPYSTTQDEPGPITRTVEDAARMLDVMAAYDPGDPITAFGFNKRPASYTASLDPNGLKGARIGVLTSFLGQEAVHREVNAVVAAVRTKMTDMGASVLDITIPDLAALTENISVTNFELKAGLNGYFARLGPRAPVKTLEEFIARGEFHPTNKAALESAQAVEDGLNAGEYKNRLLRRHDLRQAVMAVMAERRLDAIMYPHQRRLVALIGDPQLERNGILSNATGFPALTFPGGFSAPTSSAPLGVPVGIELLGADWSEPVLIKLAYAFEQAAPVRKPPVSTPPLK